VFKLYGEKMFVDYFANDVFLDKTKMDLTKVKEHYQIFSRNRGAALKAMRATSDPTPVEDTVTEIASETLILWGENDKLIPLEIGQRLNGMIKNSVLKTIPNSGHSPLEEVPDSAAKAVWDFLKVS